MGINQSHTVEQSKFLNEWMITENLHESHPIWRSCLNPKLEVEEYPIYAHSQDEIKLVKRFYEMRKNSPQLVKAIYLKSIQKTGLCTGGAEGKLYIERIYLRLSDLQHVPYPDSLHLMFSCLAGYRKLYRETAPFKVQQDQIGFTQESEAKVWLDSDFSSFKPKMMEKSEYSMVFSIVQLIEDHIDPETLPKSVPSLRGYIYMSQNDKGFEQETKKVGFDQALIRLRQYANIYNNGEIPKGMECIRQVGVRKIIESLKEISNENHNNLVGSIVNQGGINSVNHYVRVDNSSLLMAQSNYPSYSLHKTQSLNQLHFRQSSPQTTNPITPIITHQLSPRTTPVPTSSNPISLPSPNPRASFHFSSQKTHFASSNNFSTRIQPLHSNLPLQKSGSLGQLSEFRPRFSHHIGQVKGQIVGERPINNISMNGVTQKVSFQPLSHLRTRETTILPRPSNLVKQSVRNSGQGFVPFRQSFNLHPHPPSHAHIYSRHQGPQKLVQLIPSNLISVVNTNSRIISQAIPTFIYEQSHQPNLKNPQQPKSVEKVVNNTSKEQVLTPNKQPIDRLENLMDEVEEKGVKVEQEVREEKVEILSERQTNILEQPICQSQQPVQQTQFYHNPKKSQELQISWKKIGTQSQPELQQVSPLAPFSQQLIHHNQQSQTQSQEQQTVVILTGENIQDYADVLNSDEADQDEDYYQREKKVEPQVPQGNQQQLKENYYYEANQASQQVYQYHESYSQQQALQSPESPLHQQNQNKSEQQFPIKPVSRPSRNSIQSNTINIQISKVTPLTTFLQQQPPTQKPTSTEYQNLPPINTPIIEFYKRDSQQNLGESPLENLGESFLHQHQKETNFYQLREEHYQPVTYSIDSQSYKQELYDEESNRGSTIKEQSSVDHNHSQIENNNTHDEVTRLKDTTDDLRNKPTIQYSFDQYFDRTLNNYPQTAKTYEYTSKKTYQPKPTSLTQPSTFNSHTDLNLQDGKSSSALLEEIRKITSAKQLKDNENNEFKPTKTTKQTFEIDYDIYNSLNSFNNYGTENYSRRSKYNESLDSYNHHINDNYNYGQNFASMGVEHAFKEYQSIHHNQSSSNKCNQYPFEQYHVQYDPQIYADIQKLTN